MSLVSAWCKGCDYLSDGCCLYILANKRRRPCPGEDGCTEYTKITIDGADELPAEVVAEIEKIAKGLAGERSAKVKVGKVEAKVEKTSEENSAE